MKKNYDIVIFDLDNTLVNDTENIRYAFKRMLEYFRIPYNEDIFLKWLQFDKEYWITTINYYKVPEEYQGTSRKYRQYVRGLRYYLFLSKYITLQDALDYNDSYINDLSNTVVPMQHAEDILNYLVKNYPLYILTDGPTIPAKSKLEKAGFLDFFQNVYSADMTVSKTSKPNTRFFEEFKDSVGFNQSDKMILIGDSPEKDVQLAMNTGIDSVWYNPNSLATNISSTYEVNDLLELKRIL